MFQTLWMPPPVPGGIVEKLRMNKHSYTMALITCGLDDLS